MRRRTLLSAATGLSILGPGAQGALPGEPVAWPDGVMLLDGSVWAPKAGHAQIVVRWATWCAFCRRHNARLEALWRTLGPGTPLQLLTVAGDRDPEAVRRHVRAEGWHFPVTMDGAALAGLSASRRVIPLTMTVDRQGRLREIIPGEMAGDDLMALANLAR